jgi:hypothetical protein
MELTYNLQINVENASKQIHYFRDPIKCAAASRMVNWAQNRLAIIPRPVTECRWLVYQTLQSTVRAKIYFDDMVVSKHDTVYNKQSQQRAEVELFRLHETVKMEALHLKKTQRKQAFQ